MGYMGNNIFPARAGEVLRAYVLKKREDVPVSASLATVIVERILDAVVMLGFVFFNLGELSKLTQDSGFIGNIQDLALWSAIIFIGALVIFLYAISAVPGRDLGFAISGYTVAVVDNPDAPAPMWHLRTVDGPALPFDAVPATALVQDGAYVVAVAIRQEGLSGKKIIQAVGMSTGTPASRVVP